MATAADSRNDVIATGAVLLSGLTIGFNNAVLAEAGMSFLNIGVQPPESSLGYMLSDSQSYITLAPYTVVAVIYFCINYPASKGIEAIERRMRRGDKH